MQALAEILGGVGLFLFGMAAMTSGLRKLAGDRLRNWLRRSTRNPASGVVTGATVTALIQSSSATTLAAIGFVGAGLMTFSQALGIIFGANIGTTLTGWMVALLGFKLKLTTAALPLLALGAALYLFKERRMIRASGKALSGFCLLFIGIGFLQEGLTEYRHVLDFSHWPAQGIGGRLLLLLLGVIMTMITQSSSATVATVVTALNAGVLTLPQAAAVVIGADIGTTFTAALATIGAPTASRRTGFAHVIYNVLTGFIAFLLLPLYLWTVNGLAPGWASGSPELATVAFHSGFNALGVLLILPFTHRFARLIERLFPEKEQPLTRAFNPSLLRDAQASQAALEDGLRLLSREVLRSGATILEGAPASKSVAKLRRVLEVIPMARDYAVRITAASEEGEPEAERIFSCLHVIDQIERLAERLQDHGQFEGVGGLPELREQASRTAALMRELAGMEEVPNELVDRLKDLSEELEEDKRRFRQHHIQATVTEGQAAERLEATLDAQRWIRRIAYHTYRLAHHQYQVDAPTQPGVR